jgi:hypothetical protein
MPAEVINEEKLTAPLTQREPVKKDPRAGLTSDVDALLAVFDEIEAEVAADTAVAESASGLTDDVVVLVSPDKKKTPRKQPR